MRKASREMDAAFALEVLDKAPYVTVSMTRPDGSPYGLPLSILFAFAAMIVLAACASEQAATPFESSETSNKVTFEVAKNYCPACDGLRHGDQSPEGGRKGRFTLLYL